MKTTKDRMGGFISAKIIDVNEIDSFQMSKNSATINLIDGKDFTLLDIVKNGVEAFAPCTTLKSGKLYNIDITIEIKEIVSFNYTSFNKYLAILELPTGEHHLFGTPDFPLSVTAEPIYSKTPSGRVGGLLKLKGKQPNNVLII